MAPSVRGKRGQKTRAKQASGSDSIGLQCRSQQDRVPGLSRGALAPRTRPTPHDLDDFDPQCHLIRTPTSGEAFSPASWPIYTRLDRGAVSSWNRMVRWALLALG